jgi:hypothetical protein
MARSKKAGTRTIAMSPIGRAASTFSDSAGMPERGPLGPASAPNLPGGTQPNMAY